MNIKDFEVEKKTLLKDEKIREAYLNYLSAFPHQSAYFRSCPQYKNQSAVVNGKKTGTDINMYKFFTEQFYHLLTENGFCGIVVPSGIYTDLGIKGLRDLLFNQTQIAGLFCFENRKEIFENVHRSFKFITLTFQKGGTTECFRAAFMRHEVTDLERFRKKKLGMVLHTDFIHRLSPDSFSVMEFKNELEVTIAEKMLRFPLLGQKLENTWNVKLTNKFHMTNDSHLFRTEAGEGRLPLYEGKMIHQFRHDFEKPKYFIDENDGLKKLGGNYDDYKKYRLAFREVASSTNERGLIATLLPLNVFANHKLMLLKISESRITLSEQLQLITIINSFVFDFQVRQRTTTTISMFTFYQLPVPRLTSSDPAFTPLVAGAARLICTDAVYAPLWEEVMGEKWTPDSGIKEAPTHLRLRAEMDARVAHLYQLTTEEFQYILTTFPLVDPAHKEWALTYFMDMEREQRK